MWNIMKAQFYQITRDVISICILILLGILYVTLIADGLSSLPELNGGLAFVSCGENISVFMYLGTALLSPRICGWDLNDKTINYEILSGHKKSEIFFGRLFLTALVLPLLYLAAIAIPVLIGILSGGWGPNLSAKAALIRCLLAFLCMLRFLTETVFLTFLVKNSHAAMAICYMLPAICALPVILSEKEELYFLSSLCSLLDILNIENSRGGFANGKDIRIYLAELDSFHITSTCVFSITVIALCVLLGYLLFKKGDMK